MCWSAIRAVISPVWMSSCISMKDTKIGIVECYPSYVNDQLQTKYLYEDYNSKGNWSIYTQLTHCFLSLMRGIK